MKLDDRYLKQTCVDVPINTDVFGTVKDMKGLCFDDTGKQIGVGLAANQAGIKQRIIVVLYGSIHEGMINPVIEKYRGGIFNSHEGCLSYPDKLVTVIRHKIVRVSWFDEHWKPHKRTFRGLLATIVQHEIDHLNGVDMFDRRKIGLEKLI